MSANVLSGSVFYLPRQDSLGNAIYDFYAPTPEEATEFNGILGERTAEQREFNERWARESEARLRKDKEDRARMMQECRDNFPVEGVSGEFDPDTRTMRVWSSKNEEWDSPDAKLVEGTCTFCGFTGWHVLEIDNSDGEYPSLSVCRFCIDKVFDAALKAVTHE